jgi:hypothetical protein
MLKTGQAPNIQRSLPGVAPEDENPPIREHKHYQSHIPPRRVDGNQRIMARDMAQSWLYVRDKSKRVSKMTHDRTTYPELYQLALQELEGIRSSCGRGRCSPTAMRAAAHETIGLSATLPPNFRDEVDKGTQTPAREPDPLHPVKAAIDRARGRMEPPTSPVQFDGPPVENGPRVTYLGEDAHGIRHLLVEQPLPVNPIDFQGPVIDYDAGSSPADTGSSYSAD